MKAWLLLIVVLIFMLFDFWWAGYPGLPFVPAYGAIEPVINCKGGNVIQPLVRDFDGRLWRVDVCAVAQSDQDGSEFKTEVKR